MNNQALILDTETHDLNGYPIEIAYTPCRFTEGELWVNVTNIFGEYYSCPEPISFAAMAVHHILEEDIAGKPAHTTFRLPEGVEYLIGHNIDYDIQAVSKCGQQVNVKGICTLALARMVWPDAPAHNLSTLYYMLHSNKAVAKIALRNAHSAVADIILTGFILKCILEKTGVKDMQSLFLLSEQARIPSVINFGKYKGTAIKDIPADYKQWLLKQTDLDMYLRKALEGRP